MADISVTAASVKKGSSATVRQAIAAETITAGQTVYLHTDGTLKKAIATSADAAACVGIALNNGAQFQPIDYVSADVDLTIGATVAVGAVYIVSPNNAGGICLATDAGVVTGSYVTIIGVGTTTGKINMLAGATQRSGAAYA